MSMIKDDCIFCKIANGEIPAKTVYEDDMFRAILDLSPATKGHTLLLPKKHYGDLFELEEACSSRLMVVAQLVAQKLKDTLHCQGLNVVQNNGQLAGQTVLHYHLHLIPRYEGDGQTIHWKPSDCTEDTLESIWKQIQGCKI